MQASKVNITSIKIIAGQNSVTDISKIFKSLNIKESIGSTTINGFITIEDDINLYESLPILGQEWLSIEFENDSVSTIINVFAYKVSNFKKINPRRTEYTLHFCSYEFYVNLNKRVRRSFKNASVGDIIYDVLTKDLKTSKKIIIEPTFGDVTYIAPNINPFLLIKELLKKSSTNNNSSGYVFYENRLGYVVAALSSIITQPSTFTYKYGETFSDDDNTDANPNYFTIEEFSVVNYSDTIRQVTRGMFSSQLHTIDLISRNIQTYNHDYFSEYDKVGHLNSSSLYKELQDISDPKRGNQFFNYIDNGMVDNNQSNSYVQTNDPDRAIDHSSLTRLQSNMHIDMLNSYVYRFSIPGNIALLAGNVIDIEISSPMRKDSDIILSGKVLITSVTHMLSGNGTYKQAIETTKDSFIDGDL